MSTSGVVEISGAATAAPATSATALAITVFVPLACTEDVTSLTTIKAPRALLNTTLKLLFMFCPFERRFFLKIQLQLKVFLLLPRVL